MGMFDDLRCDAPLPDDTPASTIFQTKDFACNMATHVISADGVLILDLGHHEDVPREERPYPNAAVGSFDSICGIIRWVPNPTPQPAFHGLVYFYTLLGKEWRGYNTKFTDGKLVIIERVDRE